MVVDTIVGFINWLNGIVWGMPAIVVLLGTGLAISIMTAFIQIRHFGLIIKNAGWKGEKGVGEVHPLKTWTAVMGATVGVGNIAGVGSAIYMGGPGALFWMAVTGLLGMVLKATEVVLGIKYRKVAPDGTVIEGGTPYYIRQVPIVGGALAVLFAIFAFVSSLGIGNMVQASNVAYGVSFASEAYGINPGLAKLAAGVVLFIVVALVVLGGIKRIAEFSAYFVPIMAAWYILAAVGIILLKLPELPSSVVLVLKGAFSPLEVKAFSSAVATKEAVAGGVLGWTAFEAIRYGVARGLFSNEAGLGSAPNAYAFGRSDHPGRQGFYGMLEVFVDTLVICMLSGLVIITTGAYATGEKGAALVMEAFTQVYGGLAALIVGVALAFFALSTLITWAWYGEVNWIYFWHKVLGLPERPLRLVWRIIWILPIIPAAVLSEEYFNTFWNFSDAMNGLMAIPNLVAVIVLAPIAIKLMADFASRYEELSK